MKTVSTLKNHINTLTTRGINRLEAANRKAALYQAYLAKNMPCNGDEFSSFDTIQSYMLCAASNKTGLSLNNFLVEILGRINDWSRGKSNRSALTDTIKHL